MAVETSSRTDLQTQVDFSWAMAVQRAGEFMLERWKRAVVHLEAATDSEHLEDRIRRITELHELLERGDITPEEHSEQILGRTRDVRYHGTALFLAHGGRRYLLTARHVIWDEQSAGRELEIESQRVLLWPEHMRDHLLATAAEQAQHKIFGIIFRVPSLDEVRAGLSSGDFLMNLGAGVPSRAPYTLSAPSLDAGLISLDQRNSAFADGLVSRGFVPVDFNAVADGPETEGQDVFTVGYPSSTALIGQVQQSSAQTGWSSSFFSLPVSSFGRVAMLHSELPFFWADMSIYPGNSGGPVVANDELVGIVSAQAVIPIDGAPQSRSRIPFAKIIKASVVRQLLETQVAKDAGAA